MRWNIVSITAVCVIFLIEMRDPGNQVDILLLYNNQINARALIGQSAVGYCYYKPTEKSCAF